MYGWDILCGISKVPFEIPNKKYLTHTLKDMIFKQHWNFQSSYIYELIRIFETPPRSTLQWHHLSIISSQLTGIYSSH